MDGWQHFCALLNTPFAYFMSEVRHSIFKQITFSLVDMKIVLFQEELNKQVTCRGNLRYFNHKL